LKGNIMSAERIEQIYADKYNTTTTSRKNIGDIYVDDVPINIKSNDVNGENYSPNLMSADKLFDYLSDSNNELKFMFVDYENDGDEIVILNERLVNAEHISWDCLSIQCQGRGVIQVSSSLKIDETQTREEFLKGFSPAYEQYLGKEREKLNTLEEKYANA
tara:strand:+ start:217 stop:699 length:483 start_codon:yes stop_codon:yes gene_type:complete